MVVASSPSRESRVSVVAGSTFSNWTPAVAESQSRAEANWPSPPPVLLSPVCE